MRFLDLEPSFLRIKSDTVYERVESIADADGVDFLCPRCFETNQGRVGTHGIICWRPRVPLSPTKSGPGRWELVGTSLSDLSLVASPTSVKLEGGCNAHFIVRNGEVTFT